jgi:hypothetical protein
MGHLNGCRYVLHDRDAKFWLHSAGPWRREVSATSSAQPQLEPFAERWVRSVNKEECLSHRILFGERSLRKALISSKSIITKNATIKARTTFCSSPPLLGLSPVGDVASAVENASAAYSDTTVAPHEYFDQPSSGKCRKSGQAFTRRL